MKQKIILGDLDSSYFEPVKKFPPIPLAIHSHRVTIEQVPSSSKIKYTVFDNCVVIINQPFEDRWIGLDNCLLCDCVLVVGTYAAYLFNAIINSFIINSKIVLIEMQGKSVSNAREDATLDTLRLLHKNTIIKSTKSVRILDVPECYSLHEHKLTKTKCPTCDVKEACKDLIC
jgi:hypothetical protein